MRRRSSISWLLASGGGLLLPVPVFAQIADINDAINKAGRQRMLSQRMAKTYMAIGQKIQSVSADKIMNLSMALFDRQLIELKAFAPAPEIKASYGSLEGAWNDYKVALIEAAPVKAGAEKVMGLSGKVMGLANQVTVQLEGFSGRASGKLVNMSGRQRMLSQRMAANYLCASWGVQIDTSAAEMAKSSEEFTKAHDMLKNAPETSALIKSELQLVESQFAFFEIALKSLKPGSGDVQAQGNVFTTSERILQVMDGVTGMYSKLA